MNLAIDLTNHSKWQQNINLFKSANSPVDLLPPTYKSRITDVKITQKLPEVIYLDFNLEKKQTLTHTDSSVHHRPVNFSTKDFVSSISSNLQNHISKIMIQKNLNSKLNSYQIRKNVIHELEILHFNFTYLGTTYLIECIIYVALHKKNNLEIDVFPIISRKFAVNSTYLKLSMKRAISYMYEEHIAKKLVTNLNIYFHSNVSKNTLSIKMIIFSILHKV